MIRSMTGFGAGKAAAGGRTLRAEVSSVNARGLTVKVRLPEALSGCQPAVEAELRKRLDRGTFSVTVDLRQAPGRRRARLNRRLLAEYVREFEAARKGAGNLPPPDWATLAALPGVVEPVEENAGDLERILMKALDQALGACERERAREGRATAAACRRLLDQAEKALGLAEARREEALTAYKGRLSERFKAALAREGLRLEEPELRKELLLHAERSDIAEEVSRLQIHIGQARLCLAGNSPAGRRLDFLAQEMMREANTLGSKSPDAALTAAAIDLKTALDRLKEQVQNIE